VRVAAELTNSGTAGPRRSQRRRVRMNAAFREGHARAMVDIIDLSATGVKIESHLTLQPNTRIWIRLPGLEPLEVRVAWVHRFEAGCEFIRPLHPAVFERVAAVCGETTR